MKKSWLLGAVCACIFSFISTTSHAAAVSGQGTWETTLEARDLDGNLTTAEAYYDTVLDITWLTDTNYAGAGMQWDAANSWATSLDPYSSGITGWRLPTIVDTGTLGCNIAYSGTDCGYNVQTGSASTTVYSEMASMFYDTLGNLAYYDTSGSGPQPGWGLTNTGVFDNVQPSFYWSGVENAADTGFAWLFNFLYGDQGVGTKNGPFYAWAVHNGDVGTAVVLPLEGRLPMTPGGDDYQAYYDPNLDITWGDVNTNSVDTWDNQVAWAAELTIGGVSGWRLPSADVNGDGTVVDCFGGGVSGCEDNEMGFLYWEEGITAATPGTFSDVQAFVYWSGTEFGSSKAWDLSFVNGDQSTARKRRDYYAWAVHNGDVGTAVVLPLEGRLPMTPGGDDYQAYYDPNLDITWAADSFMSGLGTWDEHMAWAAGLTIGGVSGWRLPSADVNSDGTVVDCFGGGVSGCEDNEMGFLYWEEGITAATSFYYWSGTVYLGPPEGVWDFAFGDGSQTIRAKNNVEFAWAVRTGDVAADDSDSDGIVDVEDNCIDVPNGPLIPDAGSNIQLDTDGDGYGNMCDGDLNNDGSTNTLDLNLYKLAHRTSPGDTNYNADADFNGDVVINTLDLNIYKGLHRKPPGPSCCAP